VGTHAGLYKGKQYFECPETHGIFVKIDKVIKLGKGLSRVRIFFLLKKKFNFC
jgi:hypothetical protein